MAWRKLLRSSETPRPVTWSSGVFVLNDVEIFAAPPPHFSTSTSEYSLAAHASSTGIRFSGTAFRHLFVSEGPDVFLETS